VTGLPGHAAKDVRSKVGVVGLFSGLERQQEVVLGGGVHRHVMTHPAGDRSQVTERSDQLPPHCLGVGRVLNQRGCRDELSDDCFPRTSAAIGVVQRPECLRYRTDLHDLLVTDPFAGALDPGPGRICRCGRPGLDNAEQLLTSEELQKLRLWATPTKYQIVPGEREEFGDGLGWQPGPIPSGSLRSGPVESDVG
jgi:hypothetical protein